MRDFRKIVAWRLADDLAVSIYEVTRAFPREEAYGLTSQIRRASYSVPANIAEGSSRSSQKDYLHFLQIARGSLSETQYFIHLSRRLALLSGSQAAALDSQASEVFLTLNGLIRAVAQQANGDPKPGTQQMRPAAEAKPKQPAATRRIQN